MYIKYYIYRIWIIYRRQIYIIIDRFWAVKIYGSIIPTIKNLYVFICYIFMGDARGVMVIVIGNGHGDTSSNPGRDWLHFT